MSILSFGHLCLDLLPAHVLTTVYIAKVRRTVNMTSTDILEQILITFLSGLSRLHNIQNRISIALSAEFSLKYAIRRSLKTKDFIINITTRIIAIHSISHSIPSVLFRPLIWFLHFTLSYPSSLFNFYFCISSN